MTAALGVLAVSLYVSHTGLVRVFHAGELAGVLTALLVCLSILQWVSMGRARSLRAAEDHTRANLVALQATLLAIVEATLNWNGVLQLAATGGADWTRGAAPLLVGAFAIGGAWLNLTVKHVSCEPIEARAPATSIESEPPPAARDNVLDYRTAFAARTPASRSADDGLALLRQLMSDAEQHRQALMSRKDPRTGQWKKGGKRRAAA